MRLCVALAFCLPAGVKAGGIDFCGEVGGWTRRWIRAIFLDHGFVVEVGCELFQGLFDVVIGRGAFCELTGDAQLAQPL